MPERNAEMFHRLADHFEAHPETWNQASWGFATDCGTHACIAGWACIFTHGEAAFERRDGRIFVREDFDGRDPAQEAGCILGIDDHETDLLFSGAWRPRDSDLPGALRLLADGEPVEAVTGRW